MAEEKQERKPAERAAGAAAEPNGKRRLIDVLRAVRRAPSWVRQKPVRSAIVVACVLLAGIGVSVFGWMTVSGKEGAQATLDRALVNYQAGNFERARELAESVRASKSARVETIGGAAFVLGAVAARNAEIEWNADARRKEYLVAARYLDEAFNHGFPPGHEAEGLFLLGLSMHESGQYAMCVPALHDAIESNPDRASEVHRLLASAYFRTADPDLGAALRHNRLYLADAGLAPEARHAALLDQARLLLRLGDGEECQKVLEEVPVDSRLRADALVLRGQLHMHLAGKLMADPQLVADGEAQAKARVEYEAALKELRLAQASHTYKSQATQEAQYLMGLCLKRLGDDRAAESQFAEVRQVAFGTSVGLAAALEEADLLRAAGKDEEALGAYRSILDQVQDPQALSNPWVTLSELRDRLTTAYDHYRQAGKYQTAFDLVRSLGATFPRVRTLHWQAETNVAWAESLIAQAEAAPPSQAPPLAAQARKHFREAGGAYALLAHLERTTAAYPDYVWQSADNYRRGHDYHNAVRMLNEYLKNPTRQFIPRALVAMGQSQMALDNLDEALRHLLECVASFPRHPDSYRARLIAAQVHLEQGQFDEAKSLLQDNLHNEALTPRSLEWRDSLFALGRTHYREGLTLESQSRIDGVDQSDPDQAKVGLKSLEKSHLALHEAIQTLSEAVDRYPQAPQATESTYLIAESYRQASKWPRKRLAFVTIESTRATLNRQLQTELQTAVGTFDALLAQLNERQDKGELSSLEKTILRNCYFARADALFDMEQFEAAIAAYSSATNRYHAEPESLEAFVQIARCYRELNRPTEARGTLEQAKVVLKRIPPEVEFTRTTRYSRDEWEQLLQWLSSI